MSLSPYYLCADRGLSEPTSVSSLFRYVSIICPWTLSLSYPYTTGYRRVPSLLFLDIRFFCHSKRLPWRPTGLGTQDENQRHHRGSCKCPLNTHHEHSPNLVYYLAGGIPDSIQTDMGRAPSDHSSEHAVSTHRFARLVRHVVHHRGRSLQFSISLVPFVLQSKRRSDIHRHVCRYGHCGACHALFLLACLARTQEG